ncbi:hypothetical protein DTL21_09710 [Bremerella cremea]|uniref:TssC1 N-terminal domain-containing protein n=1 Tax=Blastopirellula marina TaxID=124 RepID=A0A2S8FVV2_9BACT|nr:MULTISPECIES: type VI secretion system contractile sheath large subunit [Pirellulaceae]PQO36180.1 hypothetical protein C5Y83_09705 [Blastopirellula marina]RCS48857.1 hypothetical protein DTL21_09710 [Bremerella cremea]
MAEIQVGAALARSTPAVNEKTPLHVLLLGNFRGSGHAAERSSPKPVVVDRDNLYELPEQLGVRLDGLLASSDGQTQDIEFHEYEDFEPDQLFEKLEIFEHLRTLRRRLQNPKHFDAAAAEVLAWTGPETSASPSSNDVPVSAAAPGSEDLFADVLSQSVDGGSSPLESGDWNGFIQGVLAASAIQRVDPRQDELVAVVDEAIQETMRQLLSGPRFRSLEMNWHGLRFLTFQIETHAKLKFYLLDMTEEQFHETLGAENWQESWLVEAIITPSKTPGATSWGLVGCLFPFSTREEDLTVAKRFGSMVEAAGAGGVIELLARKGQWLNPDDAIHETWNDARMKMPMTSIAGLWPRVQLRLPYGKKYRSTERFLFEEISSPGGSQLAWGSPVWLACAAIAHGFNERGWGLDTAAVSQFSDLPLYFDPADDGDAYPCGEHLLTDQESAALMEIGLSPIISFKNQDRVQIRGLQSLRGGPLHGPWKEA